MKHIKQINLFAIAAFAVAISLSSCQKDEPLSPSDVANSDDINTSAKFQQAPTVPTILQVPAGNCLFFHVYATGTQIYVDSLNSSGVYAWILRAPEANLYLLPSFNIKVGTHYRGPTWANNHGSVLGAKLAASPSPDPLAIPWLLVQKVSTTGYGVFSKVSFIQRINTAGGLAPATVADATNAGQVVAVPYTAEYYFYKQSN